MSHDLCYNGGLCWADEAYFIKLNRTSAVTDYRNINGRVVNAYVPELCTQTTLRSWGNGGLWILYVSRSVVPLSR